METRRRQPIGVELVKRGIVKEKDIENALQYQREHPNRKLGDILYLLDVCEPSMLIEAIGDIVGEKGVLLVGGITAISKTYLYFSRRYFKRNCFVLFSNI